MKIGSDFTSLVVGMLFLVFALLMIALNEALLPAFYGDGVSLYGLSLLHEIFFALVGTAFIILALFLRKIRKRKEVE